MDEQTLGGREETFIPCLGLKATTESLLCSGTPTNVKALLCRLFPCGLLSALSGCSINSAAFLTIAGGELADNILHFWKKSIRGLLPVVMTLFWPGCLIAPSK